MDTSSGGRRPEEASSGGRRPEEASSGGRRPDEAPPAAEPADENPVCPTCRGARFVHPRLENGRPDYERLVPCRCLGQSLDDTRMERMRSYSNLGALARLTFENLIPEGKSAEAANQELFLRAFRAAQAFAASPQGWLVLTGPSDSGKTHLGAAIAGRRISDGHRAMFMGTADLLDHLRSTYSPDSDVSYDQLFTQLKEVPLLVLDDLGGQSSTQWAEEKLTQLIDHRFVSRQPTVFAIASNVSLEGLKEKWRTRLTDPSLAQVFQLEKRLSSATGGSFSMSLPLLQKMTFESFDFHRINLPQEQRQNLEHAYRIAAAYAESPEGWLVLHGENGCGKTHLAAAIANRRLGRGLPVSFVFVPDFLDHLRSTYAPDSKVTYDEMFEMVKNAPLLVLDDYGEHAASAWAQEKLYQLINHRYNARLPMVVTMCCSLDDIETRVGSRLADRQISLVFAIMAPDYRTDRSAPRTPPPYPAPRRGRGRGPDDHSRRQPRG